MCLAIPGKIEAFVDEEKHFARADISGVKRQINVDLLREEGVEIGDWILIHVGFAMSKISEEQAQEQFKILETLGEAIQSQEEALGYSFEAQEKVSSAEA